MAGGSRGRGREPGETANLSSVDMMFELRSKLVSEAVLTCAGFAGPTYWFDPWCGRDEIREENLVSRER